MTHWPKDVIVLDESCNLQGPYGIQTPPYPNTLPAWVDWEFRTDADGNNRLVDVPCAYSNHLESLDWWTSYYRIMTWARELKKQSGAKQDVISSSGPLFDRIALNPRIAYNLAWAYHGYVDGQELSTLKLLTKLQTCDLFQKLKESQPTIPTHFDAKNYAKKEVKEGVIKTGRHKGAYLVDTSKKRTIKVQEKKDPNNWSYLRRRRSIRTDRRPSSYRSLTSYYRC